MEATVIDLAQRVERLEQRFDILQFEHGDLRDMPFTPERRLTLVEQGRLMTANAKRNAVRDSLHFRQVMKEMGVLEGPALSRKELQRRFREAGHNPNATDFAQGIVAMREE